MPLHPEHSVAGVGSRDRSEERAPDFPLAGTGRKAVHVACKQTVVGSAELLGKLVCRVSPGMPDVKQIAHDHADKLILLGITVTDKEAAVQRFLKRSPLPYPVVHGPSWKSDLL